MEKLAGKCLCGSVTFECSAKAVMTAHCHCTDCQKISGTGHTSNIGVPSGSVTVNGQLTFHDHTADSGNVVTGGFCSSCGCDILTKNSGMPQFEFLRASVLHNLELFQPDQIVYTKNRASWDCIDPTLPKSHEMPDGV